MLQWPFLQPSPDAQMPYRTQQHKRQEFLNSWLCLGILVPRFHDLCLILLSLRCLVSLAILLLRLLLRLLLLFSCTRVLALMLLAFAGGSHRARIMAQALFVWHRCRQQLLNSRTVQVPKCPRRN